MRGFKPAHDVGSSCCSGRRFRLHRVNREAGCSSERQEADLRCVREI